MSHESRCWTPGRTEIVQEAIFPYQGTGSASPLFSADAVSYCYWAVPRLLRHGWDYSFEEGPAAPIKIVVLP